MMKRDDCLRLIASHVPDDIVVATYTSAFDWLVIRPHVLNYVAIGAMGLASSHALGVALGSPDRRVVVLDGDGSLLMNLGSLVTIAEAAPANLVHFVCVNRTYEANGGHPIPGAAVVDFERLALGAGLKRAQTFRDLSALAAALPGLLAGTGPVFVSLLVEPGEPAARDYEFIHSPGARETFRKALQD